MNLVCQHECNEKAQKRNSVNASQATMEQPSRTIVHAKLEMTNPDSLEEVEADAAANDIVQGGKIARSILAGSSDGGMAVSSQMESRLNSMQGEGQIMPDGLRNMMERGFNRDFSQVRLHTDSEAASLSSSIHAKAFTHGNDIYFNQGQFSPNTSEGQKLMAHELTHVMQGGEKVARKEDPERVWNELWNRYPREYTELEQKIAYIIDESITKSDTEIESLLKGISDWKKRNSVRNFIKSDFYMNQYKNLDNTEKLNIIRTILLYDNHFYSTPKDLGEYVNTCGVKLSIALARAGIKLRYQEAPFLGWGFKHFGVDKIFPVTKGPTGFKSALDKQFAGKKVEGPITITLTTQQHYPSYPQKNAQELNDAKKSVMDKFYGHKGIIVMLTNLWDDAGGHVTLWNGTESADDMHIRFPNKENMYQTFYLYEFKDIDWIKL